MVQNAMFIKQIKIFKISIVFLSEKKSKDLFGTNMIAFYMGLIIMDIIDGAFKVH